MGTLLSREWLNAAEIAAEQLPGLPVSRSKVSERALRERWDETDLARRRSGRGGGLEYHYSILPAAAQLQLVSKYALATKSRELVPQPGTKESWAWFERQAGPRKNAAKRRVEALAQVQSLTAEFGRTEAVRQVSGALGVSASTLYNWIARTHGVGRSDALPALTPLPRGGGAELAIVDDRAWEALRADYLRLSEPSFASCFRRLERAAAVEGWALPSERSLRRRIDALPDIVRVLARQGADAAEKLYPAQERDRTEFHALQAVNADGHKWDVFVRWEDGRIGRPVMLAYQDLLSGKFLSWRYGDGENWNLVRLAFGDMCMSYGIPEKCWLDNGRAFASKWLTGGVKNRYRFKVKPEEPLGIMTQLGVEIHWARPFRGQSKPIERAFRDFCNDIARAPQFQGAYTGNSPLAKPEDYGNRAIPIAEFKRIVDHEIMLHNARPGRQSRACGGKLSFNQVFEASYAQALIRKPSDEQIRMCLLARDDVRARRNDGAVHLLGNRYWHEQLVNERGKMVTVRFDPDQVHADLPVYRADGTLICVALLQEAAGFGNVAAAREHNAARKAYLRAGNEMLAAEKVMSLAELVALQPVPAAPAAPVATIVKPVFGNLAAKQATRTARNECFEESFEAGLREVLQRRGQI